MLVLGTTSFDGGGPAKEMTACDARATTASAADFFNSVPPCQLRVLDSFAVNSCPKPQEDGHLNRAPTILE